MTSTGQDDEATHPGGLFVRPPARRPPDRHILLGVSHPSDDPARHRVFEVRASFDAATGGWVARIGEQNLNEQREPWGPHLTNEDAPRAFPTPAACLGDAVAIVVAMVDREAGPADPRPSGSWAPCSGSVGMRST